MMLSEGIWPAPDTEPAASTYISRAHAVAWAGFFGAGCVVGCFAWGLSASVMSLLWLLLLPLAWGFAADRASVALLMLGYFLGGSRGLPHGSTVFFGDLAPHWFGWGLWIAASLVLTMPFVALWSNGALRAASFAIASCVLMIPPFGLIGWVNPIAVAGVIFPGSGWIGLILTILTVSAIAKRRPHIILLGCCIALVLNGLQTKHMEMPLSWRGVNTHFAKLSSAGSDNAQQLLASMKRVEWVVGFAKTLPPDSVTVLPETILGSYDGLTQYSLADLESELRTKRVRLIVGAEIPVVDGRYHNSLIVLGASKDESAFVSQKIPVPVSMWKPFSTDGAVASIFSPRNIIGIGSRRTGVAICYEQLLPYSLLATLSGGPDTLIAVSNVWWARSTSIPNIQRQTTDVFARLFAVGVVSAVNI